LVQTESDILIGRSGWWVVLSLLAAILLAPLLIADVPPVLDYPNHLARFVLLAAGPDDPVLGRMFTPSWSIIPDLAVDVIGPPLLHLLPVHVAGRCLLGGILLLNLAGVLALHRSLFGRRSYWPLASGLVAYNNGFLLGFLNWGVGSGLAMLFAAAWLTWRDSRPATTVAVAAAGSVILFFCHLMGLMFFLLLIGSAEVRAIRTCRDMLVRSAVLLAVVAAPTVLAFLAPIHDQPLATHWMDLHDKLIQIASPFINYNITLDLITAALLYGGVAIGVASGWFVLAPRAIAAVTVLVALYAALPFDLMSASFVDTRVAMMLGFLLFAAVDPSAVTHPAARRAIAAGLYLLFAVRMAVLADAWTDHRQDLADLRAVIALVPPGALVYMTNVPPEEAPAYWDAGPRSRRLSNTLRTEFHMPALLVIERGAFWPILFANPAQQPIRLRPAYARLAQEAHDLPSHAALVADPSRGSGALRDFDFVLMLEAGADTDLANFVPRCLTPVVRTDFAALFRVARDRPDCGSGTR
jgi:hypothetical protein